MFFPCETTASFCAFTMESDCIERLQRISLTSVEGEIIKVHSDYREKALEECSLSLIGRFLTTKPINSRAAKSLLRSVWKFGQDLRISDVGDGLFQFKFTMDSQIEWVLNNGPWSFDGHILLLRRWEKGMTAYSVNFTHISFWVKIWGLPFDLMNVEVGRDIGGGIGNVLEVDCKAITSDQARFLRVRVEVPLSKPLRRGAPILSPDGDTVWVAFQYERLQGLCFNCGILGHELKTCTRPISMVGEERQYGEWLRAGFRRQKDVRGRKTTSPPPRSMEETAANQIRKPSTQVHISVVENSNGNPNIMETEIVEKLIPNNSGFEDGQTSIPFQIESPTTTQVTKIYTAREEIEENHDTNLVLVPITYEATNVELKCDPHVPETHPTTLSRALSCEDDQSLANVRKWKRVVKKETNPLKLIMAKGDHITDVLGQKRRKNVKDTNSVDIDVRKKTRGQVQDPTSTKVEADDQPRRTQ